MSLARLLPAAAALGLALLTTTDLSAQRAPQSPRDSVKATIAGATVSVNYGRPFKRGRDIFGALVPWNTIWRTGANEATTFTTSKALSFGSINVPAGTYTLYTLPSQDGKWLLAINKQTGQWGTEYDQARDLARVPLTVTALPAVVEQMQLTIAPAGAGGELAMSWDRTKAAARFTVAK
ncbi:MAG: DUF2911 domain-containing protein [Gemmatimonadaceae bacterium]|jgi:hypothetical protein|nr:DUF2911 domain-containing protein [Gemmatimonadaceae bacterium]